MIRETSVEAYRSIRDNGSLSENQLRVYAIIYEHGPLIGSKVSERYKEMFPTATHSEVVRNRITDLFNMGLVKEVGRDVDPQTKRPSIVWDVTPNLPKKVVKVKSLRQQLKDLAEKLSKANDENFELRLKLHICNDLVKAKSDVR